MSSRPDRTPLPVDAVLGEVLAALEHGGAVVVRAPPGAGKTSRVPVALSGAPWLAERQVVVLEPRRVAARAAARRMAAENGWELGGRVGYQVRFDRVAGPATRILVVTEGVYLAWLQRDPFLDGVGAVVFDEFHERSLELDLALAMSRRTQREVRPELRLVVMSATLEAAPVAAFLGGCAVVDCAVRSHPVELSHLAAPLAGDPAPVAARAAAAAVDGGGGDVLVFLPGLAWIERAARALQPLLGERADILRLHGSLPAAEQDRALQPAARPKVVLATNLAESSVTVDGVRTVVDSGLARVLRYDRGCGLNRLETVRIARAAADQRAGRAGRQGPGRCLRLWTAADDRGLRAAETPEIARLELSGAVLQLLAWGEPDPLAFPWLEAPPAAAVAEAIELLRELGAVASSGLTPVGRAMAALPLAPRLARLLVAAAEHGALAAAALTAAVLSEGADPPAPDLAAWVFDGRDERWPGNVYRVRDQLERMAGGRGGGGSHEGLGRAVLAAFPDRIACRRSEEPASAVMVGGRGLALPAAVKVGSTGLLVALAVDAGVRGRHADARVDLALAVEEAWLPAAATSQAVETEFDGERVRSFRRRRWRDLVVAEGETRVDAAAAAEVLAAAASERLDDALGLEREEVAAFLARVRSLAVWRPELGLPSFAASELAALLPVLCGGRRALAELRRAPLVDILRGTLTHQQLAALEREAPERVAVPSGSRVRLVYNPGRPPVLAVRLQELFGLTATPTVAGGRVRVLLHLLAPNGRPQQVTDDLASFWATTYPQVRAELRGRYPKHHWPEDPLAAPPTRGAKRR